MTKNFRILAEFEIFNDSKTTKTVTKKIEELEGRFKTNYFDKLFFYAGEILEIMMKDFYLIEDGLDDKLSIWIKKYKDENNYPTTVSDAMFTLSNKRNKDSHVPRNNDKEYILEHDEHECVNALKLLWIVIRYFAGQKISFSNNEDEYKFNASIYIETNHFNTTNYGEIHDEKSIQIYDDEVETRTIGIFDLISSKYNFFIPTYQREYKWTNEQVETFLQDIMDRIEDETTHYFGAIAITINKENNHIHLIDGQQRVTTSLLLIRVLIEEYKSRRLNSPEELSKISLNLSEKYVNKRSWGSITDVNNILKGNNYEKNSRAYENYLIIKQYVKDLNNEYLERFYSTFVLRFKVAKLAFENSIEKEIQIFENLNGKGMSLSSWDLIKNHIYKNIEHNFLIHNEGEVDKLINSMFVSPSSITFGEKKDKELSDFFIIYARIMSKLKGKVLEDKSSSYKLFAKMWRSSRAKIDSIVSLRKELMMPATLFMLYRIIVGKLYDSKESKFSRFMTIFENIEHKTAHLALVISILYSQLEVKEATSFLNESDVIDKINNTNKIDDILTMIEKYIVRLIVTANKGQSLHTFFDGFIGKDIDEIKPLFINKITSPGTQSSLTPYKEFHDSLKNKNDWQAVYAKAVLRRFEFTYSGNIGYQKSERVYLKDQSLEHILPDKPNENHPLLNIGKSKKQAKINYDEHKNMIGNYLLMNQSWNSKSSNKHFLEKKILYANDSSSKLITGHSLDKLTLMNILNCNDFNYSTIQLRSKQLADLIAPLYKFEFE